MNKKVLVLLIFLCLMFFNLNIVSASCECEITDCAKCGCVLSSDGTKCVYTNYNENMVSCGKNYITNIPSTIPKVVSIAYRLIQIAIPVLLVIFGMLDLFKGITAQKEDEIKKGQQILIKRVIAAVLVFFMFSIVKFVISVVADTTGAKILSCAECFIENNCDSVHDKISGNVNDAVDAIYGQ